MPVHARIGPFSPFPLSVHRHSNYALGCVLLGSFFYCMLVEVIVEKQIDLLNSGSSLKR